MPKHKDSDWWKSAVFYQIYPKSFRDMNGDGTGDLLGIIERLDYIRDLGVDGIWLSPIYESPQRDNGYDVSDYRNIDPRFGTMEDFDALIRECEERGLTVIMDLVLNHTSDLHPWFQEARRDPASAYHDLYIWRDGNADEPPNDIPAVFGGSAWNYVPEIGKWYYGFFSPYQPDLNWQNPRLREALYDMIRFWTQKGVGGFRLDAVEFIGKDVDRKIVSDGKTVTKFLREMREQAFPEEGFVTVGETLHAPLERAVEYTNPDGSALSMIFQGDAMMLEYADGEDRWHPKRPYLPDIKKSYAYWQDGLHERGWDALYISNHDLPRIVSSWGDDKRYRKESAKMLAVMIHGMQGTPFVYQGEEIGMTNIQMDIGQYDDLETRNRYEAARAEGMDEQEIMEGIYASSRDNARTPMQWSAAPQGGFTDGTPWLPVNPNYEQINVEEAENDPDSILAFYRRLIALRKEHPVLSEGTFTLLEPDNENTFCYTRDTDDEHMLIECNFTDTEQPETVLDAFRDAELLLTNYEAAPGPLRPYEARILLAKKPV